MLVAGGCRSTAPAIDPSMESFVPPGALVLAGVRLSQLRASPLYSKLPPSLLAFAEPVREASDLIIAYSRDGILLLARGSFRQTPAGATLVAPNVAAAGSDAAVRAAAAQHRLGRTGAPALLDRAEPLARDNPIWLIAQGGATTLPLPGNWENLNRVLHSTDYVIAAAKVDSHIDLRASGICRDAAAGRELEDTIRAMLSMATAVARDPTTAALLRSIQLAIDGRSVTVSVSVSQAQSEQFLQQLAH